MRSISVCPRVNWNPVDGVGGGGILNGANFPLIIIPVASVLPTTRLTPPPPPSPPIPSGRPSDGGNGYFEYPLDEFVEVDDMVVVVVVGDVVDVVVVPPPFDDGFCDVIDRNTFS